MHLSPKTHPLADQSIISQGAHSLLPRPQYNLNRKLIQLLIAVAALTQGIRVECCLLELLYRLCAIPLIQQCLIPGISTIYFLEELLYLRISVKMSCLFLEHVVGTHAAERKIPYSLLILRSVRMCIKVARP